MDPLKEAAWKSDFKLKQKWYFWTLVPLATLYLLYLVKFSTQFYQESKQKTLPKINVTENRRDNNLNTMFIKLGNDFHYIT